ncbi:hypothetical protein [Actinomadura flavalba]|uniref:hypothetical protein n=1 Tax=Actinomadura flavalba TaxID=1120938 RepID=UPI00037EE28B|nr:hypothetical protein [Actinomadura flavalba]
MSADEGAKITRKESALLGTLVEGTVLAVFRWGVIVDLNLSHVGLIDALYVDDGDVYEVGGLVTAYLTHFDEHMEKFWLRPPGQTPVSERLREKGF